jgi:hypothetical protein
MSRLRDRRVRMDASHRPDSELEPAKRTASAAALVRTDQRGVYLTPNRGLLVRRADDERRAWWVVIDLAQDGLVVADGRLLADIRGEAARLDEPPAARDS